MKGGVTVRITVLAENTACEGGLTAEHGLSMYIQTEKHGILFDMGQTDAFAKNAQALGISLEKVDVAVLSHGHYDHGGGLEAFLNINGKASVYVSEKAFGDYYNGTEKYIGLNKDLMLSDRIVKTGKECRIGFGLQIFPAESLDMTYGENAYGLTVKTDDGFRADPFLHEQYLMISENGKRYLISGCSHRGILNIVSTFKPDVLIGGFHFMKLDPTENEKELSEFASILSSFETKYYTMHCTGTEQFAFLKKKMGDRLEYLSTGCVISI